jgi:exopolyphosphatase/guanosine-5'-triphosphate,3'-diphosphate pyrophosphatase
MHRYSNKREGARYKQMFTLVSDEDKREAAVLGKAMRLGAMLWLGAETVPGNLAWNAVDKTLTLDLDPRARALYGEVAEQRFKSLASTLDATGEVRIRD